MTDRIDPKKLKRDANQPRTKFDEDELKILAETYKHLGIVEPIEVDEKNVIIRGERRWRASLIAKLKEVPINRIAGLGVADRLERQLLEAEQHSPMDRAWSYATAIANINQTKKQYTIPEIKKVSSGVLTKLLIPACDDKGRTPSGQAELSRRIGIAQTTIGMYIKLVFTDRKTQDAVDRHEMPIANVSDISAIDDEAIRKKVTKIVREEEPRRDVVRSVIKAVKDEEDVDERVIKKIVEQKLPDKQAKVFVKKVKDAKPKEREMLLHPKIDVTTLEDEDEVESEIPDEVLKKLGEQLAESHKEFNERMKDPKTQQNIKQFKNWKAHLILRTYVDGDWLICPYCGKPASEHLIWACEPKKSIKEGIKKASDNYK